MIILGCFFLFLYKNICCGYSLEAEAFLMSTHSICLETKRMSNHILWRGLSQNCYQILRLNNSSGQA